MKHAHVHTGGESQVWKPEELVRAAAEACAETKGMDLTILDVEEVFGLADYFVIVSGRSDRQVQGISNRISDTLAQKGAKPLSVEGLDQGHWVLMDYGDVIVHVFYEPLREHYDMERLWIKAKQVSLEDLEVSEAA